MIQNNKVTRLNRSTGIISFLPFLRRSTIKKTTLVLSLLALLLFSRCDTIDEGPAINDFDRATLLTGYADQLIIPNFIRLNTEVNALNDAFISFKNDQSEANLTVLQEAWKKAIVEHQHCSGFGFGPADITLGDYASVLGAFPVSPEKIESSISNSNFHLATSFDRDIRGFYAIEYFIFGDEKTNAEIVSELDIDRLNYLEAIISELHTTVNRITEEWQTEYRSEFIGNTGTSRGSSISLMYNAFVKDYENIKNFKIELPAGLSAGQSGPEPHLVEARYSGIGGSLILANWESVKNIYLGQNRDGEKFSGFRDYVNSTEGGTALVEQTLVAMTSIDSAIVNLPEGRLVDNLESDKLKSVRDLLQKNTANFKSSMSSLLGISITFNSGDGD